MTDLDTKAKEAATDLPSLIAAEIMGNDHLRHMLDEQQADEVHGDIQNIVSRAIAGLLTERAELHNGTRAVLPHTLEHARNLYTVAVACMKSLGEDPEASPPSILEEAATIERCAKVADAEEQSWKGTDAGSAARRGSARRIAAAIRSLKENGNG